MEKLRIYLSLLLAVFFFEACSSLPVPRELHLTSLKANPPTMLKGHFPKNLSLEDLLTGRTLFINKCSGCHHLYHPREYSLSQWSEWIDEMVADQEVELTDSEKKRILIYIAAIQLGEKKRK